MTPVPFKFTPKNISNILQVRFVTNAGVVTGFKVGYEVNYETIGLPLEIDLWDYLNDVQKAGVQAIYDKILAVGNKLVQDASV